MIDQMQNTIEQLRAENAALKDRCGRCDSKGTVENTIYCADCLEWYREEYATHCPDESAELLNGAHALNRRQAARIEEMDSRVAAYQSEIAQMGRIQSAHLSELADYATTTQRLNRRVEELTDAITNYRKWYDTYLCRVDTVKEYDAALKAAIDLDAALANGVTRD